MLKNKTTQHAECASKAAARAAFMERWAERYPRSQEAVERDRLARGAAKHRAHLFPITSKSLQVTK